MVLCSKPLNTILDEPEFVVKADNLKTLLSLNMRNPNLEYFFTLQNRVNKKGQVWHTLEFKVEFTFCWQNIFSNDNSSVRLKHLKVGYTFCIIPSK